MTTRTFPNQAACAADLLALLNGMTDGTEPTGRYKSIADFVDHMAATVAEMADGIDAPHFIAHPKLGTGALSPRQRVLIGHALHDASAPVSLPAWRTVLPRGPFDLPVQRDGDVDAVTYRVA